MSIKYFIYSFVVYLLFFSLLLFDYGKGDLYTKFDSYSNIVKSISLRHSDKKVTFPRVKPRVMEAELLSEKRQGTGWLVEPKFEYPVEAEENNFEGEVILLVEVLGDGTVVHASLEKKSGHSILDRAALDSIYNAKIDMSSFKEGEKFRVKIPYRLR
tara:strand:- start:5553 stop:6023 length:471 start_codon:yes stop_codon:yes gene_type:complete